jgi:SRSO17 transposase
LAPVERQNAPQGLPQLAEASGDKRPDATPRLLYQAQGEADAARERRHQFVIEVFGDEAGIAVVDETGFNQARG